jgi:type III pantothenate kinase
MIIVEIGNTAIKIAEVLSGSIRSVERFLHDDYGALTASLNRLQATHRELAVAATGKAPDAVMKLLNDRFSTTALTAELPTPLQNSYETPQTLGIDRLANAVMAAISRPLQPVMVIDLGTCVTYDLVVNGTFIGGAIAPGLHMRIRAMAEFTAALPMVELPSSAALIGKNTHACLQSGSLNGWMAELEGMMARYSREYEHLEFVVTGGDLCHFEAALKSRIFADPLWTIKGYHQIYLHHAAA